MQGRRSGNRLRESLVMAGENLDLESLSSDLLSPTLSTQAAKTSKQSASLGIIVKFHERT